MYVCVRARVCMKERERERERELERVCVCVCIHKHYGHLKLTNIINTIMINNLGRKIFIFSGLPGRAQTPRASQARTQK